METEKSFSGEEAEKDFCGRLFFLAAIFPFSNEKACLGVIAKTDFFYRLTAPHCCSAMQLLLFVVPNQARNAVSHLCYAKRYGFHRNLDTGHRQSPYP